MQKRHKEPEKINTSMKKILKIKFTNISAYLNICYQIVKQKINFKEMTLLQYLKFKNQKLQLKITIRYSNHLFINKLLK